MSLVARPEIKRIGDLKGRTLSVDARTTGYAFVLLDMLRRGGLAESDYQIVNVGGMVQRWDALREGKQDATLLSAPYDILAEVEGFNRLTSATSMIGRYQGNVAAAKRSWAAAHDNEVVGCIRAYVAAIDWLYDAANRDEAVRILTKHLPQMPHTLAQQSHDLLFDREEGFFRQGRIDLYGLKTVLQLRSRHAEPKTVLTDPARYYDPAYHDVAMRGCRARAHERAGFVPEGGC